MKDDLEEELEGVMLRLKNGAHVNARKAIAEFRCLQILEDRHPEDLEALQLMAEGKQAAHERELVERLMRMGFLTLDGTVQPLVRDVLLSSKRETSEGRVLVQPFQLEGPIEKAALQDAERRNYHWLMSDNYNARPTTTRIPDLI